MTIIDFLARALFASRIFNCSIDLRAFIIEIVLKTIDILTDISQPSLSSVHDCNRSSSYENIVALIGEELLE